MAKLIQCKDCGNQISKNAKSCPNCGAKNKQTSIITWLALIFIGIPVLMAIFGGSPDTDNSAINNDNQATNIDTEESAPIQVANWDYSDSKDEMRGDISYYAVNTSQNSINLDFPYNGGTYLTLAVRNTPENGNEIIINTDNGQLWCEYRDCYMSAKFDNGEVKKYPLAKAAAGSSETMFLDGSIEQFVSELKNSEKAMIEIGFFNYGNQQFEFETSGLEWSH